jgi:hypothetical protein
MTKERDTMSRETEYAMVRTEIERLRDLAKAATRGTWEAKVNQVGEGWPVASCGQHDGADHSVWSEPMHDPNGNAEADARHIAAWSPARVLKVLDLLDSLDGLRPFPRPEAMCPTCQRCYATADEARACLHPGKVSRQRYDFEEDALVCRECLHDRHVGKCSVNYGDEADPCRCPVRS